MRGHVFTMGLAQCDELWAASEGVGPLVGPILRYYAVAQLAQAIAAASDLPTDAWQTRTGHGLKLECPKPPAGDLMDLRHVIVSEHGGGMLAQVLGSALGSPVLSEPVSLASLMAALPFVSVYDRQDGFEKTLAVELQGMYAPELSLCFLTPLPTHLTRLEEAADTPGHTYFVPPTQTQVDSWLRLYPTLAGLPDANVIQVQHAPETVTPNAQPGHTLVLNFREGSLGPIPTWPKYMDLLEHRTAHEARGLLMPKVAGNDSAEHPFVTWFVVLYALSMLARYHPAAWRMLMDVDRSQLAVPLQRLIERDSENALSFAERSIVELPKAF